MKNNVKKIYVQLLDEGTESYRPVNAVQLSSDVFRITFDLCPIELNENWEFQPNDVVKVITKNTGVDEFLLATKYEK